MYPVLLFVIAITMSSLVKSSRSAAVPAVCGTSANGFDGVDNTFCMGRPNGLHAHPRTCSCFYQCSNGGTYAMPCAPGNVYFDPDHQPLECRWSYELTCQRRQQCGLGSTTGCSTQTGPNTSVVSTVLTKVAATTTPRVISTQHQTTPIEYKTSLPMETAARSSTEHATVSRETSPERVTISVETSTQYSTEGFTASTQTSAKHISTGPLEVTDMITEHTVETSTEYTTVSLETSSEFVSSETTALQLTELSTDSVATSFELSTGSIITTEMATEPQDETSTEYTTVSLETSSEFVSSETTALQFTELSTDSVATSFELSTGSIITTEMATEPQDETSTEYTTVSLETSSEFVLSETTALQFTELSTDSVATSFELSTGSIITTEMATEPQDETSTEYTTVSLETSSEFVLSETTALQFTELSTDSVATSFELSTGSIITTEMATEPQAETSTEYQTGPTEKSTAQQVTGSIDTSLEFSTITIGVAETHQQSMEYSNEPTTAFIEKTSETETASTPSVRQPVELTETVTSIDYVTITFETSVEPTGVTENSSHEKTTSEYVTAIVALSTESGASGEEYTATTGQLGLESSTEQRTDSEVVQTSAGQFTDQQYTTMLIVTPIAQSTVEDFPASSSAELSTHRENNDMTTDDISETVEMTQEATSTVSMARQLNNFTISMNGTSSTTRRRTKITQL